MARDRLCAHEGGLHLAELTSVLALPLVGAILVSAALTLRSQVNCLEARIAFTLWGGSERGGCRDGAPAHGGHGMSPGGAPRSAADEGHDQVATEGGPAQTNTADARKHRVVQVAFADDDWRHFLASGEEDLAQLGAARRDAITSVLGRLYSEEELEGLHRGIELADLDDLSRRLEHAHQQEEQRWGPARWWNRMRQGELAGTEGLDLLRHLSERARRIVGDTPGRAMGFDRFLMSDSASLLAAGSGATVFDPVDPEMALLERHFRGGNQDLILAVATLTDRHSERLEDTPGTWSLDAAARLDQLSRHTKAGHYATSAALLDALPSWLENRANYEVDHDTRGAMWGAAEDFRALRDGLPRTPAPSPDMHALRQYLSAQERLEQQAVRWLQLGDWVAPATPEDSHRALAFSAGAAVIEDIHFERSFDRVASAEDHGEPLAVAIGARLQRMNDETLAASVDSFQESELHFRYRETHHDGGESRLDLQTPDLTETQGLQRFVTSALRHREALGYFAIVDNDTLWRTDPIAPMLGAFETLLDNVSRSTPLSHGGTDPAVIFEQLADHFDVSHYEEDPEGICPAGRQVLVGDTAWCMRAPEVIADDIARAAEFEEVPKDLRDRLDALLAELDVRESWYVRLAQSAIELEQARREAVDRVTRKLAWELGAPGGAYLAIRLAKERVLIALAARRISGWRVEQIARVVEAVSFGAVTEWTRTGSIADGSIERLAANALATDVLATTTRGPVPGWANLVARGGIALGISATQAFHDPSHGKEDKTWADRFGQHLRVLGMQAAVGAALDAYHTQHPSGAVGLQLQQLSWQNTQDMRAVGGLPDASDNLPVTVGPELSALGAKAAERWRDLVRTARSFGLEDPADLFRRLMEQAEGEAAITEQGMLMAIPDDPTPRVAGWRGPSGGVLSRNPKNRIERGELLELAGLPATQPTPDDIKELAAIAGLTRGNDAADAAGVTLRVYRGAADNGGTTGAETRERIWQNLLAYAEQHVDAELFDPTLDDEVATLAEVRSARRWIMKDIQAFCAQEGFDVSKQVCDAVVLWQQGKPWTRRRVALAMRRGAEQSDRDSREIELLRRALQMPDGELERRSRTTQSMLRRAREGTITQRVVDRVLETLRSRQREFSRNWSVADTRRSFPLRARDLDVSHEEIHRSTGLSPTTIGHALNNKGRGGSPETLITIDQYLAGIERERAELLVLHASDRGLTLQQLEEGAGVPPGSLTSPELPVAGHIVAAEEWLERTAEPLGGPYTVHRRWLRSRDIAGADTVRASLGPRRRALDLTRESVTSVTTQVLRGLETRQDVSSRVLPSLQKVSDELTGLEASWGNQLHGWALQRGFEDYAELATAAGLQPEALDPHQGAPLATDLEQVEAVLDEIDRTLVSLPSRTHTLGLDTPTLAAWTGRHPVDVGRMLAFREKDYKIANDLDNALTAVEWARANPDAFDDWKQGVSDQLEAAGATFDPTGERLVLPAGGMPQPNGTRLVRLSVSTEELRDPTEGTLVQVEDVLAHVQGREPVYLAQ